MPRYIIEICGFLLIMIIVSFLALTGALLNFLPIIAIYLVAGYKLLPALQNIASSYASVKGSYSSLEKMIPDLKEIDEIPTEFKSVPMYQNIDFDTLIFEKINFSYSHNKVIFEEASFKISKNDIIGIVGSTGIGKSTFIDIFCGLIASRDGKIIHDNKIIKNYNYNKIKNLISIVPQKINLLDDTIKNNIVFGRSETANIKEELEYLKKVCLLDFIGTEESKWDSIVGENGSHLSGGQIQRLGIARALYKKPQILILDEATASLDDETEKKILKNLINFTPRLTLLIITHNKNILHICTSIYQIKNKKINKLES